MKVTAFDYLRQLNGIRAEIDQAISKVLNSGKLILGNEVENFEHDFSNYIGKKFGIGVNSGTDAIKIALKALDVGVGDEVITVPNSAVPTVSALRELGAIPVFVDIKTDYTIDENLIEKAITNKTKVIMPVHLYGKSCNLSKIMSIANAHKIAVVEDCAQAHGSMYKGKRVGGCGIVSCFSFYPTKNLGTYGDGGMIITSSKKIADKCRKLRMYGMRKGYYADIEGFNSRLDEVQAAILNVKLRYLDKWNSRRREIAKRYLNGIDNKFIKLPVCEKVADHCFHQFVIRVKNRDHFLEYLRGLDIGCGIHYPYPIHLQKAYKFLGYTKHDFLNTVLFAKEIVSLPIFPELTDSEVDQVINSLNKYVPVK